MQRRSHSKRDTRLPASFAALVLLLIAWRTDAGEVIPLGRIEVRTLAH